MIKLEEWELELVKDLDNLMNDKSVLTFKFEPDKLLHIKKNAFLIKHLEIGASWVIFKYSGKQIKLSNLDELPMWDIKTTVFGEIMSQSEFASAWLQFERDYKLEKLI